MPHIILLNGAPRKTGNTLRIAEWVAEGAQQQGADVTVIHLTDERIDHCQGCETCARTGRCIIQDDHEAICQQLEQAQGVIVCAPVYGGFYSSVLKTFLDRLTCTLGFTGRFAHLCAVGVTTARYDFRAKNAKDIAAALGSSWLNPGYVSGTIHKQVMDTKKSRNIVVSPENSPRLYAAAIKMGGKLVADIQQEKRGALPLPVRLLFRHLVLPGIAKILVNEQGKLPFLYQKMEEQGIINATLLRRHAAQMQRLSPDRPWKTGEKVKFTP
ncbi:MAG TPA: flavodoxin family protein [Anaerolineae bacterium]|nr:flavodoxin family protein [Anaerolineae bacterium]